MSHNELETTLELRPRFDERGLVQAVATDAATGELLMVAHMNAEALERTLATGEAHYWSRSRREVWHKGATSGNVQKLVEARVDCDQDAIWLKVRPAGPACHTGETSCFYRLVEGGSNRDWRLAR
jgi:phosphoribosyl-AMP cyclohydrolase